MKLQTAKSVLLILATLSVAIRGGCPLLGQDVSQQQPTVSRADAGQGPPAMPNGHLPSVPRRERGYYGVFWGVDLLRAKAVESGELIQFSYRVLDPERAKPLNDKQNEAFLIAPEQHAKLIVPSLEKVGQLRQTSTPEQGKLYWMAFSNPGRLVRKGDRVNVVIGGFHIEGLMVE